LGQWQGNYHCGGHDDDQPDASSREGSLQIAISEEGPIIAEPTPPLDESRDAYLSERDEEKFDGGPENKSDYQD
jgi:hypothetical protein